MSERIASFEPEDAAPTRARSAARAVDVATASGHASEKPTTARTLQASPPLSASSPPPAPPAAHLDDDEDGEDSYSGAGEEGAKLASESLAALLADMEATTLAAGQHARILSESLDTTEDGEAC